MPRLSESVDFYKAHRSEKRGVLWLASYPCVLMAEYLKRETGNFKSLPYCDCQCPGATTQKTIKTHNKWGICCTSGDIITFTFMHLADALSKATLHAFQVYSFTFYQLLLSVWNRTHDIGVASAWSTIWATGKLIIMTLYWLLTLPCSAFVIWERNENNKRYLHCSKLAVWIVSGKFFK